MKTMDLLERALQEASLYEWGQRLGLHEQSLYSARRRGNLSPSVAGALAEQLGEPMEQWMIVAALEGERDSACRQRMMRHYRVR